MAKDGSIKYYYYYMLLILDFDVDHILSTNRIDDEHWFSGESEGILLFSYLYVLFYKFLLIVMPVCI